MFVVMFVVVVIVIAYSRWRLARCARDVNIFVVPSHGSCRRGLAETGKGRGRGGERRRVELSSMCNIFFYLLL